MAESRNGGEPVIAPVPLEELEGPVWQDMLAKADVLGVPGPQFMQILAHAPDHAGTLFDALHRSHGSGAVDHRLKEIIRVQLARHAGDGYFGALRSREARRQGLSEDDIEAGCGDFENDPRFSEAEKWALRYAWLMYRDPKKVDAAFYDEGKTHYSEAEIMELGAFIAFHYGMQLFMGTLGVSPEQGGGGK